jgi:hypothetical protein
MNIDILAIYLTGIAFVFWLGLSVFRQLPGKHSHRIFRYDIFSLIPTWKLFVTPIQNDFHLLYRDRISGLEQAPLTEWKLVSIDNNKNYNNNKLVSAIWNPTKLFDKCKFDLITKLALSTANNIQDQSKLEQTMPYQTILNYIMHLPRNYNNNNYNEEFDTQFMIMITSGVMSEEPPKPVFVSSFHRYHKSH